jgi:hypothetical protein
MYNFCTLFDSNYLTRGLATYQSLMQQGKDLHLYVFAFDDKCFKILKEMNLQNMTVVSLEEFENERLLGIKSSRSRGEYCWTCTSSTIKYVFDHYQVKNCTYIDADMFFYAHPKLLLQEIPADKNVMITEHRYTKAYDKSALSGIYCVQFMYFDNSENGQAVLNWWCERCIEWCFDRFEDNKFGDQKYLDDWTSRFEGIHVLENLGGGLAPWNIQQYKIQSQTAKFLIDKKSGLHFNPVFFHFHGLKLYKNNNIIYAPKMYALSDEVVDYFYKPYLYALERMKVKADGYARTWDTSGALSDEQYSKDSRKGYGSWLVTRLKGVLN